MSASLVGSEMCIRDRCINAGRPTRKAGCWCSRVFDLSCALPCTARGRPVSYTHLTLPTICSV
eukprot:13146938-Alexandrium_andersonii.AAC.1